MRNEAESRRWRAEPSFDEQFERLFEPEAHPPQPADDLPAASSAARPAAKAPLKAIFGLILGVAAGVLFLAIAVIVFALRFAWRPR
jgi:hypothetical protein